MSVMWIVASAVLSSLLTLLVVALWANYVFVPRLRGNLQSEITSQAEQAGEILANRVEEGVRRGLASGVQDLTSRELLEGAGRNLAKTGAEIVGEQLGNLFGAPGKRR